MCIDARASHTHICRSVEYVRVGKDGVSLMSKRVSGVFPLSLPRVGSEKNVYMYI